MTGRMRRKPGHPVPKWDGMPFHILALDPGGVTGCASAEWKPSGPDDTLTSADQIKFCQWQVDDQPHHVQLWATLDANPYTEIVWETFDFRQHIRKDKETGQVYTDQTGLNLMSREYIGVIELFVALKGTPHFSINSSPAKHLITNEKIEQLGLWLPGMKDAMDATRHLLRHMVVRKKIQAPFVDIWLADD